MMRPLALEQRMNNESEENRERYEEGKNGEMKPKRLQPVGEPVVNCEQRRDQRAVRLIAREHAKGGRVTEEERNVPQIANGDVAYDRVPVVHVEAIVKMV